MATDDDKPEEPMSEFDRMSLNSLRRELEVQKSKTAQAREDAHERIREGSKKKIPWGKVAVYGCIGLVVTGGAVFALRAMLPPIEEWSLPDIVATPHDAGLADLYPDEPEAVDAGTDAGPPAHHGRRRRRHRDAGHAPTKQPGQLEFGDNDDPIGGLIND